MDMHPSGLPHLVGPEGSPFPHTDYSQTYRYMPNNITDELPPKNLDSLPIPRLNTHPLKVRASPSSPRGAAATPHPLRLRTEHPSPGSPRELLPSSPSHLLLSSATAAIAPLPKLSASQPVIPKLSAPEPTPSAFASDDIDIAAAEMIVSSAPVAENGLISTSDD